MSWLIIFSDIDGTLIDFETYSYSEVRTTVSQLVTSNIPLVLCSSKTKQEQAFYREALQIPDPFIVENGSAIVVPEGYFGSKVPPVIVLGKTIEFVRQAIEAVRHKTGLDFQGYGDLTLAEVSRITGLDELAATYAKKREYSETIVTRLNEESLEKIRSALAAFGLSIVSGGKFHTVMSSQTNKGIAARQLTHLYQKKQADIVTVGIGDSANDAQLFEVVDLPFLVQKTGGYWQDLGELPVTRVPKVGPAGWREIVISLLERGNAEKHE